MTTRRRLLRLSAGAALAPLSRGALTDTADAGGIVDAGTEPTGTGRDAEAFDPAIDGFGFPNWAGASGVSADGQPFTYDPGEVTIRDVRRVVDDSWRTALSRGERAIVTRIVYSWIGSNAATNGHCYGMAFAADDYFRDPSALPDGIEAPHEVPHPTDEYGTVGDRIRRTQTAQLVRLEAFWYTLLGLRWGLGDHRASLAAVTDAIDGRGTGALILNGEDGAHLVLGHDYERADGVTEVAVYDPNLAAGDYRAGDGWTLAVDSETGEVLEIADGYAEFLYHDREGTLSDVDDRIGDRDRVRNRLSDAVFLGLETGGALALDFPDDVLIDRPAAPYADFRTASYVDAAAVLGSLDEIEFAVEEAPDEEYALEVLAVRDGETVLEEVVSGTHGDVPSRLRVAIGGAGEAAVEVVKTAGTAAAEAADNADDAAGEAASAAEAAANGSGATEGGGSGSGGGEPAGTGAEVDGGLAWLADNWWVGAAAGALGAGAALRRLSRRGGRDGADGDG